MKNTITRALMIGLLTTSIAAFASSDKAKSTNKTKSRSNTETPASNCTADQANSRDHDSGPSEAQDKAARERLIEQENQAWLQDLMYNR